MKTRKTILLLIALTCIIVACNKSDTPSPCNGVHYIIQYLKTESIGSSNNGSIYITAPVGDSISYSLNSGAFQSTASFINLAPGTYLLTVKNQRGCTDTATITILNYGPKYALVKQIVLGYCGPCHLNGTVNGGKNFDTDSSIVASWDRIKARAVDGIPSYMPEAPNSPLTTVDKQKITNWVNAGHRISD